jgi:uncharacterized protein YcaQ
MRPWINLSTVLSGIALSKPLATLASLHDPSDWPRCKRCTIICVRRSVSFFKALLFPSRDSRRVFGMGYRLSASSPRRARRRGLWRLPIAAEERAGGVDVKAESPEGVGAGRREREEP